MSVISNQEIYLHNSRNELLISFFEKARDFLNKSRLIDIGILAVTNKSRLKEWNKCYHVFNNHLNKLLSDRYKLLIYFDKKAEIIGMAENVTNASIQICMSFIEYFRQIDDSLNEEEQAIIRNKLTDEFRIANIEKYDYNSKKTIDLINEYHNINNDRIKALSSFIDEYTECIGDYFNKIINE